MYNKIVVFFSILIGQGSRQSTGVPSTTSQTASKMIAAVASVSQARRSKNSTPTKNGGKTDNDDELKAKMVPLVVKISDFLRNISSNTTMDDKVYNKVYSFLESENLCRKLGIKLDTH